MPTKGRVFFTATEIERIKNLIGDKQGRPMEEQKALRERLRKEYGFFITDFGNFDGGITVDDVDRLIANDEIHLKALPSKY